MRDYYNVNEALTAKKAEQVEEKKIKSQELRIQLSYSRVHHIRVAIDYLQIDANCNSCKKMTNCDSFQISRYILARI